MSLSTLWQRRRGCWSRRAIPRSPPHRLARRSRQDSSTRCLVLLHLERLYRCGGSRLVIFAIDLDGSVIHSNVHDPTDLVVVEHYAGRAHSFLTPRAAVELEACIHLTASKSLNQRQRKFWRVQRSILQTVTICTFSPPRTTRRFEEAPSNQGFSSCLPGVTSRKKSSARSRLRYICATNTSLCSYANAAARRSSL